MAIIYDMELKRVKELAMKYRVNGLHEPKRDVVIECNGAEICLRWWSQRPIVSIRRTKEECKRLTTEDKFGDVIPLSKLREFQWSLVNIVPGLIPMAKAYTAYDIQFNTMDNVAAFYYILDKIDENKEQLSNIIKKR